MWKEEDNKLVKNFEFKDFNETLGFIVRVGLLAEQQQHHPTLINEYNKLRIELNTHDAGNVVTDKDHKLAKAIDGLS